MILFLFVTGVSIFYNKQVLRGEIWLGDLKQYIFDSFY